MSPIGQPRKGFSVIAYNDQKRKREQKKDDKPRGNFCADCGAWIEQRQPHSYALGPRAGHYCFGCEPVGVPVTTVNHPDEEHAPQARDVL